MGNFTNSPMVSHTRLSPHRNSPRNQPIRKITIHHFAGTGSIEAVGNWLARPETRASYNYGIGNDGRVALYVNESDRCWGSSSAANDHQAVVIGVANSETGGDWPISTKAFATLIELCLDICRRNNIRRIEYTGNANGTLTRHNMFAATACPGRFLQSRFPEIARQVNAELSGSATTPPPITPPPVARPTLRQGARSHDVRALQELLNHHGASPRLNVDGIFGPITNNAVREFQTRNRLTVDGIVGPITWSVLENTVTPAKPPPTVTTPPAATTPFVARLPIGSVIMAGPGNNHATRSTLSAAGAFTIVEEQNGWGRLKSGAGWVNLANAQRV